MALKLGFIIGYWIYAVVIFALSFLFVNNAPFGCTENRKLFCIGANILSIGCGVLLTIMGLTQ